MALNSHLQIVCKISFWYPFMANKCDFISFSDIILYVRENMEKRKRERETEETVGNKNTDEIIK